MHTHLYRNVSYDMAVIAVDATHALLLQYD